MKEHSMHRELCLQRLLRCRQLCKRPKYSRQYSDHQGHQLLERSEHRCARGNQQRSPSSVGRLVGSARGIHPTLVFVRVVWLTLCPEESRQVLVDVRKFRCAGCPNRDQTCPCTFQSIRVAHGAARALRESKNNKKMACSATTLSDVASN